MDYLTGWLTQRFTTIHACYDWYSIVIYFSVSLIAILGLIGALRRGDRSLKFFSAGLLLMFVGSPIVSIIQMREMSEAWQSHPFREALDAQRDSMWFRYAVHNIMVPIGMLLALYGGILMASYCKQTALEPTSVMAAEEP